MPPNKLKRATLFAPGPKTCTTAAYERYPRRVPFRLIPVFSMGTWYMAEDPVGAMFTTSAAAIAFSLVASGATLPDAAAAPIYPHDSDQRHVLLISVDGLHASDLSQ